MWIEAHPVFSLAEIPSYLKYDLDEGWVL